MKPTITPRCQSPAREDAVSERDTIKWLPTSTRLLTHVEEQAGIICDPVVNATSNVRLVPIANEKRQMASHVVRGVLKQPNIDMRTILRTAGSRSSMSPHLTVARHKAMADAVDLSQSSTVRRRRRRVAESVRKRRQSSRRAGVKLSLVRGNVIVVKDIHLPRPSQGRRGSSATLRHGDHFHEKRTHVYSEAVEFKTSVSTAVPRRGPRRTRRLRRFSDGSAWHPDKRLPFRHSRPASARPLMRGRSLQGPRVQTPCITPRQERRRSRCVHGSTPRQRRVGAQSTPVRMTARVRGGTGAALKGTRRRRRLRAPAGDRDASSPWVPAGVQELCCPVSTPSSSHACPFRVIVVVVDVVFWRGATDDVALRQGYGRRCAVLPGAQLMGVMRLRRPAEYRVDHGSAVAAVQCCT